MLLVLSVLFMKTTALPSRVFLRLAILSLPIEVPGREVTSSIVKAVILVAP